MEEFLTIAGAATSEFTEKKSRFVSDIFPVQTEEDVKACMELVRKKYHDARHHCWCYRLKSGAVRYSDDGEPQGTAGQPMLAVFEREKVFDVLCVVTRYFGGILLGAGGLTRAYARGAKDALTAAGIAVMRVWDSVEISCPYALLEQIKLRLAAQGAVIEDIQYGADITIRALLPQSATAPVRDALRELSAGKVIPKVTAQIYRAAPL